MMAATCFVILADTDPAPTATRPPAQETTTGRYEFRVWPREMPQAAGILQKSWSLVGGERRSDIYLLTGHSPERLVKLRAGNRLEVKRREHDAGLLQYWVHDAYPLFPLSRPALRVLAGELGLPGLDTEAARSPGHLLARLGAFSATVLPMTVRKSRLLFRKDDTRAEICHVAVDGWTRLTLAIEDPDPERALATVEALALADLPNRSYGDMLGPRRIPAGAAS